MKKQTLKVELEFTGSLTEAQHKKIVQNVLDSIIHTVDSVGLVPDDAEEITEKVIVLDLDSGIRREISFLKR